VNIDLETRDRLARIIWDYHHVNHRLEKADAVLCLGSHDLRVAERAAQLVLDGRAPLVVFSGGRGRLTEDWEETEAERFAAVALRMGVQGEQILTEPRATHSGENLRYTRELLEAKGIDPQQVILVQKPYMERRVYATFARQWPGMKFVVTSPQIPFKAYPTEEIPLDEVISIMVGDLQRIRLYPEKGFQIPQEIPDDVWAAYEKLVEAGYTGHLLTDAGDRERESDETGE
jgi:uncharacterized SAM-binding protein YcdF (DUF218 family)